MLEVVYSYWDGSGHRKSIQLRKGSTIGHFLEQVKQDLSSEFHELRSTNAEDLMYIKEDLIIPQVQFVRTMTICNLFRTSLESMKLIVVQLIDCSVFILFFAVLFVL